MAQSCFSTCQHSFQIGLDVGKVTDSRKMVRWRSVSSVIVIPCWLLVTTVIERGGLRNWSRRTVSMRQVRVGRIGIHGKACVWEGRKKVSMDKEGRWCLVLFRRYYYHQFYQYIIPWYLNSCTSFMSLPMFKSIDSFHLLGTLVHSYTLQLYAHGWLWHLFATSWLHDMCNCKKMVNALM